MGIARFFQAWFLVAVLALSACGGGGGGGGDGNAATPVVVDPTAPAPSAVVVSGTATFDFVPNTGSGRLDYGAITAKPIRGATVELLDAGGGVLASGVTTETGSYALSARPNTEVRVRVRAQMLRNDVVRWDFTVRDNTASDAIFAIASPPFSTGSGSVLQRDIRAPSGWNGAGYDDTQRAAGPFALLDTVYINAMKVATVAPATNFPALRVFWSPANLSAFGDPTKGEIGTTSFLDSGNGTRSIYVLGKADSDTDEYDPSVVSHEWGHYYQSAFSRDDSPGGAHSVNDLLDRRLAFSEGWGNAWSGIALGVAAYTDAVGPGQALGNSLDLSTGPQTNRGWFRETSIQAIFWRLERAVGFGPIHAAMTGAFKSGIPVTSIHPFAAAFAAASPSQAGTMASLLQEQSISASTSQPWGDSEGNAGGVPRALPLYQQANSQICVAGDVTRGSKLGRYAYVRFSLASSGNRRITVSGAAATDPDFEVYQGGRIAGAYSGAAGVENVVLGLPAGESVLVIYDANATESCFTVSIN